MIVYQEIDFDLYLWLLLQVNRRAYTIFQTFDFPENAEPNGTFWRHCNYN